MKVVYTAGYQARPKRLVLQDADVQQIDFAISALEPLARFDTETFLVLSKKARGSGIDNKILGRIATDEERQEIGITIGLNISGKGMLFEPITPFYLRAQAMPSVYFSRQFLSPLLTPEGTLSLTEEKIKTTFSLVDESDRLEFLNSVVREINAEQERRARTGIPQPKREGIVNLKPDQRAERLRAIAGSITEVLEDRQSFDELEGHFLTNPFQESTAHGSPERQ